MTADPQAYPYLPELPEGWLLVPLRLGLYVADKYGSGQVASLLTIPLEGLGAAQTHY